MSLRSFHEVGFKPQFTPKEMLKLGVFGGWYFECQHDEFPQDWLEDAKLSPSGFDPTCNYFKVAAGQPRDIWKSKGWITPEDPLGWFQWYCRYFMGRRLGGTDDYQISRWRAFGPRHIGGLRANCEPGNIWCRPRQRQALLQWAYDPFF
ncbi:MAG: hypothetical protein HN793_00605 [Rhodospirillaceae bacterium]|jgi:hypothetical protein|nr:hypothetical protein [Rhodospirillaceae bacterium]MBT5240146.1 hypothetical protein [Rhodospirillaceae bacterium]MBT5566925.1 hypothetical protein [Rhodospirillaceae bacterium]MBT6090388.1 hypothetical protein [Rhodospirillaceae bacterium]MBT7449297.1 hypothetical protein [Rhodospirillaceae bacterium]